MGSSAHASAFLTLLIAVMLPDLMGAFRVQQQRAKGLSTWWWTGNESSEEKTSTEAPTTSSPPSNATGWRPPAWVPPVPMLNYGCQVDTKFGMLDRWISVTPDFAAYVHAWHWLNPANWWSWVEEELNLSEEEEPQFSFEPIILRNQEAYGGRVLLKVVETPGNESGEASCVTSYTVACSEDEKLRLAKDRSCGNEAPTSETESFGSFSKAFSVCSKGPRKTYGFWGTEWTTDVIVLDDSGNEQKLEVGECVVISALQPALGIKLHDLNYDMMGLGLDNLASNASKVDRIVHQLNNTLFDIYDGILAMGGQVKEGYDDTLEFAHTLSNETTENSSDVALNKTVKWIKRLTLSTMVETCLCCDQKVIDSNDTMVQHCKVAYTLGGENKSQHIKYAMKTASGTLYNLAQTAGGWLVPFLGGNIVKQAHTSACHFTCGLRQPFRFEPYEFGMVRQVPGLAFQTWFVPNPYTFFGSAGSVAEGAAEGAANSVATEVIDAVA